MRVKTIKISDSVKGVLGRCTYPTPNHLVLPGQLDRTEYMATDAVLKELGGKWNTKAKAHLFPDGVDAQKLVVETITGDKQLINHQQTYQLFETPEELADRMVLLAGAGKYYLEPSAGRGRIVRAIRKLRGKLAHITTIEIDGQHKSDLEKSGANEVSIGDYLTAVSMVKYDCIIANPPFNAGQAIKHVRRMLSMLNPRRGKLVCVVPDSFGRGTTRADKDLGTDLAACSLVEYHPIAPGTFKESGTGVNTKLLVVVK